MCITLLIRIGAGRAESVCAFSFQGDSRERLIALIVNVVVGVIFAVVVVFLYVPFFFGNDTDTRRRRRRLEIN